MELGAWITPYNKIIKVPSNADDSTHLEEILRHPKKYGINQKQANDLKDIYDNVGEDALAKYLASRGWIRFRISDNDGYAYFSGGQIDKDRITDIAQKLIKLFPNLKRDQNNAVNISMLRGNKFVDMPVPSEVGQYTINGIANYSLFKSESIIRFLNKLDKLFESTVDFSRGELCPEIWEKTDDSYQIKQDVEDKIYEILAQYDGYYDLRDMAKEIHVVGSIGTNLYTDDADIDVHLIMKDGIAEEERNKIYQFFENKNFIGTHPVNVYIQTNPHQELVGDALYDLVNHKWISGPLIAPDDYNPYDVFKEVVSSMPETLKDTDLLMAELKRDVIDAEGIKDALKKIPNDAKQKIKQALEAKLEEIKNDISGLYKERKNLADIRKQSSAPSSDEEAEKIKSSGDWAKNNATFKFVNKYGYLKIIKELEKFIEDDEVTEDEVPKIKQAVKGEQYVKR